MHSTARALVKRRVLTERAEQELEKETERTTGISQAKFLRMPTAFIQPVQTFCRVCQNQNQNPAGSPCVTQTGFSLSRPLSVSGVLPLQAWALFLQVPPVSQSIRSGTILL